MTEGFESYYAVLGLAPEAGSEEIRTAYRRLAMRYHPDSSGDPATARQFARVVRAYKVLSAKAGPADLPRSAGPSPRERYRRVIEAGEDLFALGQLLASETDAGARAEAAQRLGLSGRTAAYVFLRRALYDPSPEVRLAAVRASASLGARQAEGEVAALYSRSAPRERRRILETARATREPLFAATLAAASSEVDPELARLAASIKLGQPS